MVSFPFSLDREGHFFYCFGVAGRDAFCCSSESDSFNFSIVRSFPRGYLDKALPVFALSLLVSAPLLLANDGYTLCQRSHCRCLDSVNPFRKEAPMAEARKRQKYVPEFMLSPGRVPLRWRNRYIREWQEKHRGIKGKEF